MFGFKKKYAHEMKIQVEGMNCGHCEKAVQKVVLELGHVQEVKASHVNNVVSIYSDMPIDVEQVKAAIEQAGYTFVNVCA